MGEYGACSLINGMTDFANPCQELADLFTLHELVGRLDGHTLAWVGDGNNVAASLAVAAALRPLREKDSFDDVLEASDRDDLLDWLRHLPLVHREEGFLLLHAGLLPDWRQKEARRAARVAEKVLRGDLWERALAGLYATTPDHWAPDAKKRMSPMSEYSGVCSGQMMPS